VIAGWTHVTIIVKREYMDFRFERCIIGHLAERNNCSSNIYRFALRYILWCRADALFHLWYERRMGVVLGRASQLRWEVLYLCLCCVWGR